MYTSVNSVATIIGKSVRNGKICYYLDDGVYGSFSNMVFDAGKADVVPLDNDFNFSKFDGMETYSSVLNGATCDSFDILGSDIQLPKLNIGDYIIGKYMGAYTDTTSTNFNLFDKAPFVFLD